MKRLSTLVLAGGALALISAPVGAADMAVKGPAPEPVYSWTGWYVGVNAGASYGRAKTDFNNAPILINQVAPAAPVTTGFAASDISHPGGFIGGGQIGYNWQYSPLVVVGLEADFQGALEKDPVNLSNNFNTSSASLPASVGTVVTNYATKIEWFGTARVRIGYVWGNGRQMSYLTGGLAYGKVALGGTNTVNGAATTTCCGAGGFTVTQAFSHSAVNTGWVVGYGTEGAIDFWGVRNWTWRIEGLYMDLGTLDTTGVTTATSTAGLPSGGQVTTHTHFTDGILRGGLNYRFY
ncbi:MAG: outer membrane protein [Xanthobacteraceae bacterium]